jgi:hypothetical protein
MAGRRRLTNDRRGFAAFAVGLDRRLGRPADTEFLGIDLIELDFAGEHLFLPFLMFRLARMEFRHDFFREEFEAVADIFVRIATGLIEQDDLIDVGRFEFSKLASQGFGRTDQACSSLLLRSRGFLPIEVLLPEVDGAGGDRAVLRVEAQGELEEGPAVGFAHGFFIVATTHESRDQRDIGIRLIVREFLLSLHEGVVIGIDPGLRSFRRNELEAQCAHSTTTGHVDRLELRASDPQRRVGLLIGLGKYIAKREVEILAVIFPAFFREHRNNRLDRILPDRALVAEAAVEGVEFGDRGAFADSHFDSTVREQVEGADAFGYARGMVGCQLDDPVCQTDLLRSLTGCGEKDFGCRGMGVFLEEVVLDFPGVVVAELVGQFDLGQRVLEQVVLGALGPGSWKLVLVEDSEFHGSIVRRLGPRLGRELASNPSKLAEFDLTKGNFDE